MMSHCVETRTCLNQWKYVTGWYFAEDYQHESGKPVTEPDSPGDHSDRERRDTVGGRSSTRSINTCSLRHSI